MKLIYDNINNYSADHYKRFLELIKLEKKYKILKFSNDDDKKRSILGEILLIQLLNKNKINYNDITIIKNEYGKPYIKDNNLYYNISHSNEYVICAISNKEIGVDIEKIRHVKKNVPNQFATPKEIEYINEFNERHDKRCFEIYTLKEAYLKCLGTNLNFIKEVEFELKLNSIKCNKGGYSFNLIYDLDNYIVSTCEKKV